MAKQLNVNLAFNADTGKAKAQIQELQNLLNKVAYTGATSTATGQMQQDLMKASTAAKELQYHLNNAFNATTGRFDLSMLDKSLRTSKSNISSLSTQLLGAGDIGKQAFLKLAQSISSADQPMLRISNRMREFGTVMKNTIKWQLSSSMIHGFMGAINSAYGYAQDLNKSLTDIRIVTGQNTEEMARFAEQANKAAKALSTTTTDYTKASLIYFQQGLNSKEVEERTQVTIKMANATGTSAQTVSDQMTAVWNNFDDGSKSLEYYADVMTALGAATASSTDEISQGLQKFAAVSQTVGLSYEYATAALATITSNTRESADVVGTALKTLFARIQGLQLGETLEDGTNLNKYSQALAKVGISIYESNGELKAMDNILNEMAAKWETMNAAQQTALAQTVAGVRQYTQLVALMENWDKGDSDSFVANLQTIDSAEGTLDMQAEIYAQSWEAAEKRVRASAEGIYQSLLDDKFFIALNNGFANVLSGIDLFIDGLGGVKPLITAIASLFLSNFAHKIPQALDDLRYNLSLLKPGGTQDAYFQIQSEMEKARKEAFNMPGNKKIEEDSSMGYAIKSANDLTAARTRLAMVSDKMSASEKQMANSQLSIIEQTQNEVVLLKQKNEELTKVVNNQIKTLKSSSSTMDAGMKGQQLGEKASAILNQDGVPSIIQDIQNKDFTEIGYTVAENLNKAIATGFEQAKSGDVNVNLGQIFGEITTILNQLQVDANNFNTKNTQDQIKAIIDIIPKGTQEAIGLKDELKKLFEAKTHPEFKSALQELIDKLQNAKIEGANTDEVLEKLQLALKGLQPDSKTEGIVTNLRDIRDNAVSAKDKMDFLKEAIAGFQPTHIVRVSEALGALGGLAGSALSIFRSFSSVIAAFKNPDATGWERFSTVLMAISMTIPGVLSSIRSLSTMYAFLSTSAQAAVASLSAEQAQQILNMTTEEALAAIKNASIAVKLRALSISKANIAAMTAEQLALKTGMTVEQAEMVLDKLKQGQTLKSIMTEMNFVAVKGLSIKAILTSMATKAAESKVVGANTIAWILNQLAMAPVLLITLALVAAIAALALIVTAVTIAVIDQVNAYNADKIAAEQAAEAAHKLSEAYQDTKKSYEDMIQAMDNYKSAREGLDELTKGTQEYQDALKDANRQALELISNYGLIEGQDYEWQGDELVIHDKAMDNLKYREEQKVDEAYAASQMANVHARQARDQAKQTDLQRNMRDDLGVGTGDQWWKGALDVAAGLALDIGTGFASGGLGTIAAISSISNRKAKADNYDSIIEKAVEQARTDPSIFADRQSMIDALHLDINDTDLIEALWANRDSIQSLSDSMDLNAEAEKLAAQNSANEIMSSKGYQNSESGRMALEAGGEVYQQLYNEAYKTYKDTTMAGFFGKGTDAGKAMWEKYAEETGLSDLNGYKVTNYRKDGSVEYEYIDENNQKQTGIANAEMIASTLAAADAAGQLEGALSQLRQTIGQLNASQDLGDHALADFLSTGNLEGSTQAEFNDLRSDAGFNKDANGNITYDDAAVNQMLGLTGDAAKDLELAKSRGYESAQAYKDAFIKSMDVDWETPKGFENFSEELTLGATKNIENTMKQMGDEGGQAYIDTMNHIASGADWDNLTNDEQIDMMNRLANIDWTSWDAGEQAIAIAKEYGVSIDTASGAWQENIKVMRDASNALPDMKALAADMKKLGEISDDIDLGKIISQEDYELLIKYNRELGNYFTILSDGSAQFIGDKLDFKQASEETQRAQLEESIKAQQDRLTEIRAQYKAGADAVGGASNLDQYRDTENYVGDDGKNYYQGNNVQTQIDFLRSQGYDEEQLSAWETDLADGNTTVETLNKIAEAVNTTADAYNNLGQQAINAEGMIQTTMNELALTADSAAERQQMLEEGSINEAAYGQAAMAAINEEKWEDMDADEIEEYAEHLQEIAAESELLVDDLTEEAAEDVALYTKKMNKGISKLAEGFEEWNSVLENSDESSEEYAEAMGQMKDAMSDVLGTSEEFISNDFITENLEDIEKAAEGDAEAIDRLRQALSKDILCNIMAVDNFDELDGKVQALHNQIATLDTDIKVGATLETGDFTTAAQGIVDAAGMTVEQAQAYFNSLGYEPEFVMQNEKRTAPMYGTRVYTDNVVMGSAPYGMGEYPYIAEMTTHEEQVYMGEKEQNFVVPALSADGTPQIRSLTKTSSGAMNNGSSSNKGGKGKGGGGGGGSGKAPQKKNDSEKERYHTIKNQLEDLKSEYEEIGKAKSRAFGSDKLDAMDAEIHKTDELIKKQEEYIDAISKDLPVDKAVMEAYYKDVIGNGTPIEFDENGNISNYDAIQDAMFKKYNSMADSNTDDSETWKVFEEKYKQLEEYIEQYEETYDLLREEEAAYQELINQRMDLELEKIQYAVELKINIAEDSLALLEHQLDNIEDDAFKAADAIRLLGEKTELLYDEMEANKKGLMDILQQQGMNFADMESILVGDMTSLDGKIFTENQIDAIKEYRDNLLDLNAQMEEVRKSVEEKVMETFDAWHEKLETGVDTLDHYESVLSSYKNMVDIVGKDALGISDGFMDSLGAATMSNAIDQVKAAKAAQAAIENAKMTAQAAYDAAVEKGDEASKKMWEETLNNLNEEAQSAQEDMLSAWEDALSTLADLFSEKVERIVDNFNKSVYAFGGLDGLGDDFSRQQENADMILDDYEKMYELSKLNRDISKTIDETDNIAGKQKLKKLQEQINDLQEEGVEMSEYDLEYLQKTYDLRLAELELEEARNAKNTVRLSKDNEGNWSYVYTQNTDAVDAAQQKYEDALYAMQDLSKNYIDEMSEKLVSTYQEMIDQMANLKIEDFATTEEYYAELERIQKVYQEQYNKQSAEMQKAIDNNQALYEEDIEKYSSFVKDEMNLIVAYKDTILGQLTDSESEAVDFNSMLEPAVEAMLGGLKGAAETYFANLNATMEAAGTSTDSFSEDIQENITAIKTASEEATESVATVAEGMKLAFDGMSAIVTAWQDEYHDSVAQILEDNLALIESFNAMIAKLSEGTGVSQQNLKIMDSFNEMMQKLAGDKDGTVEITYKTTGENPEDAAGYDTGGYTGSWGKSGKMAMLHEKELVLNADDTSNFLAALKITRTLLDTIDLNAKQASLGLGQLTASTIKDEKSQILEQQVTITAEFPNVNDHNEIEEALNSLVNRASQYANRK